MPTTLGCVDFQSVGCVRMDVSLDLAKTSYSAIRPTYLSLSENCLIVGIALMNRIFLHDIFMQRCLLFSNASKVQTQSISNFSP